jgi:hypothetical protein
MKKIHHEIGVHPVRPFDDIYIAWIRRSASGLDPAPHHRTRISVAKKEDGVNKAAVVREALAALGNDAKPGAIQEWIKANYKVDMEATMISSYKSNELKKAGGAKSGRGGKGGGSGDMIGDIATVSELLKKHGRSNLTKLIDALDR